MKFNYKRNIKLLTGSIAGSALGYIHDNIPGAVIGGTLAHRILDNILPNE